MIKSLIKSLINNDYEIKQTDEIKSIKKIIKKHEATLAIQRLQLLYVDPYGKTIKDKWIKFGIDNFVESQILPALKIGLYSFHGTSGVYSYCLDRLKFNLKDYIDELASIEGEQFLKQQKDSGFHPKMTGKEYEDYCKIELEGLGWSVTKTKTTGDQGVDRIAKKRNKSLAIQCKNHAKPIGNKAVQEIVAGMQYYRIKKGAVVSNNVFTQSANQLALVNNIKLIHHLELNQLM